MKFLREILSESKTEKPAYYAEYKKHADRILRDIAPDLPSRGRYQHASAIDHVADRLSDIFKDHNTHEHFKHQDKATKEVVNSYFDDDSAESRKREADIEKRSKKVTNSKKEKPIKEKPVKRKVRRGISSY